MKITFEPQELKQFVQEYLVEHPDLLKNWVEEAIAKLYQQQTVYQLPDNELSLADFKRKYAVRKSALKDLQDLWKEELPAEELIKMRNKA